MKKTHPNSSTTKKQKKSLNKKQPTVPYKVYPMRFDNISATAFPSEGTPLAIAASRPVGACSMATLTLESLPAIRSGIEVCHLTEIQASLEINANQTAAILNISPKTINRYKEKEKLPPTTSEKILILEELNKFGTEVFGSHDTFLKWMNTYSPCFENKPIEILDTFTGIKAVINEIGRIKHGVFA